MKRITTLLIDDEEPALSRLQRLLEQDPAFQVAGAFQHATVALNFIEKNNIDLLLLDIEIPDLNGLQFLDRIPESRRPFVVFVTAYDQYALEAFEYFAVDYVLKPFSNERIKKTFSRLKKLITKNYQWQYDWKEVSKAIAQRKLPMDKLTIKIGRKYHFINLHDIGYVTSDKNYCEITLLNGRHYIHRDTLTNFLSILPASEYVRIHHSHLIRLDFVKAVNRKLFSEIEVIMKDDRVLNVSRKYKSQIQSLLY